MSRIVAIRPKAGDGAGVLDPAVLELVRALARRAARRDHVAAVKAAAAREHAKNGPQGRDR